MKKVLTLILALTLTFCVVAVMSTVGLAAGETPGAPGATAYTTEQTAEPELAPAPDNDTGISGFDVATVPVLVIICFGVGQIIKPCNLDNKWIPAIMVPVGSILGFLAFHVMPDFPASDPVTAVGVGIASGLAATGVHQIYKQLGGGDNG